MTRLSAPVQPNASSQKCGSEPTALHAKNIPGHFAATVLLAFVASCSSDEGKVYKVQTNEQITQADSNTILDDGAKKELFEAKDFRLTFETPTQQEVSIGTDGLKVRIKPWNEPPTATWGLYYTTAFKDLTTARPIFEELPISLTEVDWNTSSVPSGTYYLYAEGRAGGARSIYWLGTKVTISIGEVSGAPQVVISSAVDQQLFTDGDVLTLNYNAVTTDGTSSLFNIFYSADEGRTWQPLEAGTSAKTFEVTFDSTFTTSARYKIKIEADNGNLVGSAETTGLFGYSAAPISYSGEIDAVLTAKCATAGCHNEQSARGASRFNAESWTDRMNNIGTSTGVETNKEKIFERTREENDMPPAGSPQLTQEERDLLAL